MCLLPSYQRPWKVFNFWLRKNETGLYHVQLLHMGVKNICLKISYSILEERMEGVSKETHFKGLRSAGR